MPRRLPLFVALAVILLATSTMTLAGPVNDIVSRVSVIQYTNYLSAENFLYTHNGDNRGLSLTNNHHDDARTSIYSTLQGFGLSTSLQPFSYSTGTYYNVVAEQRGILYPDRVYIIGAHYDSADNPGADDNASGVAGVLEAARVLSQYQFAATIRYIAFDREEQGLIGSTAYANAHAANDILGMVSLDMIAFNPTNANHNQVHLYYDDSLSSAPAITKDLAEAFADYGGGLSTTIGQLYYNGSDHAPFAHLGFDSALVIEYYETNPNYHQLTDSVDTPGYLDYAFATSVTRAAVGYLAEHAESVPEPATLVLLMLGALTLSSRRRRSVLQLRWKDR